MNENRAEFDRYCQWVHSFNVECWQVMQERRPECGATIHEPLTPPHASRAQAEATCAAIRQDQPDAYIVQRTFFFHPEKAEDMQRREAFIASMVGEPA